jgi:hypothetical protein
LRNGTQGTVHLTYYLLFWIEIDSRVSYSEIDVYRRMDSEESEEINSPFRSFMHIESLLVLFESPFRAIVGAVKVRHVAT